MGKAGKGIYIGSLHYINLMGWTGEFHCSQALAPWSHVVIYSLPCCTSTHTLLGTLLIKCNVFLTFQCSAGHPLWITPSVSVFPHILMGGYSRTTLYPCSNEIACLCPNTGALSTL